MSATTAQDLTARIQAVEKEVAAVRQALRSGRNTRLIILLLLVVFVIGITTLYYQLVSRVQSRTFQQALVSHAQTYLEENGAEYSAEVEKLVSNVTPVLTEALQDQVKRDMPRYTEAIAAEREELVNNLKPELKKLVQARYKSGIGEIRELLVAEFPDAKDPVVQNRLEGSIQRALEKMVQEYYLDDVDAQVASAVKVWDIFPAAEEPDKDEAGPARQLIGCLLEMLSRRLSHGGPQPST